LNFVFWLKPFFSVAHLRPKTEAIHKSWAEGIEWETNAEAIHNLEELDRSFIGQPNY